jgi:hypothetical protein
MLDKAFPFFGRAFFGNDIDVYANKKDDLKPMWYEFKTAIPKFQNT